VAKLEDHFAAIQESLLARLKKGRAAYSNPSLHGGDSEAAWRELLEVLLPKRYAVGVGTVVDSQGQESHQIDLIIHDRQYTPLLLDNEDRRLVPAESVYAVIEVKQKLDARSLKYAAEKVASVRRLERTSAPIPNLGRVSAPTPPKPILGGIVTLAAGWRSPTSRAPEKSLHALSGDSRIDLGCAADGLAFELKGDDQGTVELRRSSNALLFFFLRLVTRLQDIGTVPAIDYAEYAKLVAL